ncbi:acyl-CoA dehydrogenase family protein [Patulibacter minatonensis]|uniref:acyl-CoA dehydrogenase family protein n=1 Tax=Patulibacter minatonensis TaxID=298163 RepID=UPI000478D0E0|nr:acyl-CoA dehydrogenase family protein [Patulibacter minatonensis]
MSTIAQVDEAVDQEYVATVGRIAKEAAAPNAVEVDREGRFPVETFDALKEAGALSALVPTDLGGAGVSLRAVSQACLLLGRACGSSGLIFAMHHIQVATLVRHREPGSWFDGHLRSVVSEQRLIASVTSEVGTGGNMGMSIAAAEYQGDGTVTFEKQAPTVSYGEHADDLLITLRRGADADGSDQVLVLADREQRRMELTGTWDPLGMRGTCSPGFVVRGTVPEEQVLTTAFAIVSSASMVPISHVLWSHVWLGIATEAFERARAFVRASARRKPGEALPIANELSKVLGELNLLRAEVRSALTEFLEIADEPDYEQLGRLGVQLRFNTLKTATSTQAPRVCQDAMAVCGIVGFKNDTPFSIGRQLRDAMSGCLMVANDRIHETNASLLLIAKEV